MLFSPLSTVTKLLFPEVCRLCGKELSSAGRVLCPDCSTKIHPPGGERCIRCGRLLISAGGTCLSCRTKSYLFASNLPIFPYTDPFKELFLRYKFGGDRELGAWLAGLTAEFMGKFPPDGPIVPVPGNPKSIRKRGMGPSRLYCTILTEEIRIYGVTHIEEEEIEAAENPWICPTFRQSPRQNRPYRSHQDSETCGPF